MNIQNIISSGLALSMVGTLGASAQQAATDSTMNREMVIERAYNPIVRDAEKITRMPEVETPQANKIKVKYAESQMDGSSQTELTTLDVGSVNTSYNFDKRRGYLKIGAGNYMNIQGLAGYRFLDSDADILGVELQHRSTNGKIRYVEEGLGKSKQRYNDDGGNVYYSHAFESFVIRMNVAYDYSDFNYYGLIDAPSDITSAYASLTKNSQTQRRLSANFSAITLKDAEWNYKMLFGFNGFYQTMPGIRENNVNFCMGLSKRLDSSWRFAVDVNADALFYGGESDRYEWNTGDRFSSTGVLSLLPYFDYQPSKSFSLKVGVHTDLAYGVSPYIGISPDIRMNWLMTPDWLLYADVTGGIEQYSLNDMSRGNRYYYMDNQLKNSYTIADLRMGIRSNPVAGFWFDVYGAMGYTENALFEYSSLNALYTIAESRGYNCVKGYIADGLHWNLGVKMKYQYSDKIDLGFSAQKNGWNMEKDQIASYKPSFEGALDLIYRPLSSLSLDLKYAFSGGCDALLSRSYSVAGSSSMVSAEPSVMKMRDIHELSLLANWNITSAFSIYCSANNLLMRRQAYWYGMPEQGFHLLAGGCIRF